MYPGNAGIDEEHRIKVNDNLYENQYKELINLIEKKEIDLVIVGPEQPLVDGIEDHLRNHCLVFGPSREGAMIEGSKSWARSFMERFQIPSPKFQSFSDSKEAIEFLYTISPPYVIKADGIAAGKGVIVTDDKEKAILAIKNNLENKIFGSSSNQIVIEEFLEGLEASVFALCDGERAVMMQPVRDYKRAYDKNQGPNTGGMGSVSPVEYIDEELKKYIQREIFDKTIRGFKELGISYKGILYAGLMIHKNSAKIVEFNCRFGDPETQSLLLLLKEDLLELCCQSAAGNLRKSKIEFDNRTSICVVIAAEGYPDNYKKNIDLTNFVEKSSKNSDIVLFHAGTEKKEERFLSTGGRIFNICSTGNSIEEARFKIYSFLEKNKIPDTFYRKDIGILY